MSAQGWTTEKPTTSGFYWHREDDGYVELIDVTTTFEGSTYYEVFGSDEWTYLNRQYWMDDEQWSQHDKGGEFFGPLSPPR